MMIASPGIELSAQLTNSESTSNSAVALAILERVRKNRPEWNLPVNIEISQAIPEHQGLGSGTQLGMAVTEAIGRLNGETHLTPQLLASDSRRGQRSSIGLYGYFEGGFLVDAGHQSGESIGQIACRFPFPENWRLLLVTPHDQSGMHGHDEARTFTQLPAMSQSRTGELSHLTLTEILPALKHTDFAAFSRAIYEYGMLVGDFFTASQGGIFAHPEMESFVEGLRDINIKAVAQSSWGPTVAIFANGLAEIERIAEIVSADDFGKSCILRQVVPLNTGRKIDWNDEL